jgi:hypothetical protein
LSGVGFTSGEPGPWLYGKDFAYRYDAHTMEDLVRRLNDAADNPGGFGRPRWRISPLLVYGPTIFRWGRAISRATRRTSGESGLPSGSRKSAVDLLALQ